MSTEQNLKHLIWVGSSLKDLRAFPKEVKEVFGYALYLAQSKSKHPDAKPLKGFGSAGVLEIVDTFKGSAYLAVYTVKIGKTIYVLHAFKKKSKRGVSTPDSEIELIRKRLKMAHVIDSQEK